VRFKTKNKKHNYQVAERAFVYVCCACVSGVRWYLWC